MNLKQDITKLKTFTEYASIIGKTRQRVFQMVKSGELAIVQIGKKKYIKIQ